jgi:hypothetical protein
MEGNVREIGYLSVPMWAGEVVVSRDGEDLIVSGNGIHSAPLNTMEMKEDGFQDLLARYYRAESFQVSNRAGGGSPHLEFVNAKNDEQLIVFVEHYGPVAGEPGDLSDSKAEWVDGDWVVSGPDVQVIQRMAVLRSEQRIFAKTVDLMSLVNDTEGLVDEFYEVLPGRPQFGETRFRPKQAVRYTRWRKKWDSVCEHIVQGGTDLEAAIVEASKMSEYGKLEVRHWNQFLGTPRFKPTMAGGDLVGVINDTQRTLCAVFNSFPTYLYADDGATIELPEIIPTGILPTLYFMLRENYRQHRRFKACELAGCPNIFLVGREGARYCSERCSHTASQRKYWDRAGKKKRDQARKRKPNQRS